MEFPEDGSLDYLTTPKTLLDAALAGVQAEEDNIAMYEKFLSYDLPANVRELFTTLDAGSRRHLQAFQRQVDRLK